MKLTRLKPETPEWGALLAMGVGDYVGEKEGATLWAICDPEVKAVVGFMQLTPWLVETHLWVAPQYRGRWWSREFYKLWQALAFKDAHSVIASEEDAGAKVVRKLGWKKVGTEGQVSYYLLTREDVMRG